MSVTSYMILTLPDVLTTASPIWASQLNTALGIIDSHTHTINKGTQIPIAGINVNADLDLGTYHLINVDKLLLNQLAAVATADNSSLFLFGGDLYYRNSGGTNVQVTAGAGVNVAAAGSISGMGGPEGVAYSDTGALTYSGKFVFTCEADGYADIECGDLVIRERAAAVTEAVRIQSPAALVAGYDLILPIALPGSTSILSVTAAGQIVATNTIPEDITSESITPVHGAPNQSLEWKDVSTITIKAGRYFIANKWNTLGGDTDWSWTMDDGGAGDVVSTWYYLYAYLNAGVVTPIASAVAPTDLYNTNIATGAFDVNIYLGAFYNNAAGNIVLFYQKSDIFLYSVPQSEQLNNTTSYTAETLQCPPNTVASFVKLQLYGLFNNSATLASAIYSHDNSNEYIRSTGTDDTSSNFPYPTTSVIFDSPHSVSQTGYIKQNGNYGSAAIKTVGWVDKWV